MRSVFIGVLMIVTISILAQNAACKPQASEITNSSISSTTEALTTLPQSPAAPETISPSQAALSLREAENELQEKGYTVVDTINKASQLTGYRVAAPSFIPEGFLPQIITNSGSFYIFSIRGPTVSPVSEFPYDVQQVFRPGGLLSSKSSFLIIQSKNQIGAVGQEDVDIGGNPGKKMVLPEVDTRPARLALTWNDGLLFYSLEGILDSQLDEATLVKVAASVKPQ